MRLASFRIRNFKSIIDSGECHLSDKDNILILAGQNEAGKSAIIEALDFFRNGPTESFEKLFRRQRLNPQVDCCFKLEKYDLENIDTESDSDKKLVDYLTKNPILNFRRGDVDKNEFAEFKLTDEEREKLNKFFPESPPPPTLSTPPEGENPTEPAVTDQATAVPSAESSFSLDDLEDFLIAEARKFIFYDSFSDLLPGEVTIDDIPNHPAVLDFQKVFNADFAKIIKMDSRAIKREEIRINQEASDNLNQYWNQKLEDGGKYNFVVKIVPLPAVEGDAPKSIEAVSRVEFYIERDDQDPLYLEQKSKGFRWFSSFNLRLRALGVVDHIIKNLVILIDEPGQGLHEKAQLDVKKVIEELGAKGAQIIYSTHHPILIGTDGEEFTRIRLISNTKKVGTIIQTPAQYASSSGSKDAFSPIITAMGIYSISSVLDTKRLNVVVEGISDHYYLSAFQKLFGKDERLAFLPACGVSNVHNLVSVLIGWGCSYKAVFDDDAQSGRKAYNLLRDRFYEGDNDLAHENILKIKDCNGIEDIFDSKDFYAFVLDEAVPKGGPKDLNSKLAEGKKELLARLFLEKVKEGKVTLNAKSTKNIEGLFTWIYQKFGIV